MALQELIEGLQAPVKCNAGRNFDCHNSHMRYLLLALFPATAETDYHAKVIKIADGDTLFRADCAGKAAPSGTIFPSSAAPLNLDYAGEMRVIMRVFRWR